MAIFNKDIPEVRDPNYIGYSREHSNPQVSSSVPNAPGVTKSSADYSKDSSAATAITAMGNSLKGIVGAADTITKQVIDAEVSGQVEQQKADYTSALEQYLGANKGMGASPSITDDAEPDPDVGQDELTSQRRNTPREVEQIENRAGVLVTAKENGKISQTDFYARLTNMAKDLRARYPGYKDYVDQKFQAATGFNPANAQIRSLVQDINTTMSSAAKAAKDEKAIGIWYIKKYPGLFSREMQESFLRGELPAGAIIGLGQQEARRDLIVSQADRDMRGDGLLRKDAEQKAVDTINLTAPVHVNTAFENLKFNKLGSGKSIGQFLTDVQTNANTATTEEWLQIGQTMQAMRRTVAEKMYKDYTDRGYIKVLGGADKLQKLVEDNMVPFDRVMREITEKNVPAAQYLMESNKALITDGTARLYSNKELREDLITLDVFHKISPEYGQKMFTQLMGTQFPDKLKKHIGNKIGRVMTQSDIRSRDNPYTLKKVLEELQGADIRDQKTMSGVIENIVTPLADPNAPAELKISTAKGAYDPSNWGVLSKFKHESVKLEDGTYATGQYAAYRQLTKDAIVDEMWKLRAKNPETWNNFKSWTMHSFGNELMKKEIELLNNLPHRTGMRIGWDSDSAKFRMYIGKEDVTERDLSQFPADPAIKDAYRVMHRVNWGLDPIRSIAKKEGANVDEAMIGVMMNHKFDPVDAARINYGTDGIPTRSGGLNVAGQKTPVTIPEVILKAVIESRAKDQLKKKVKPAKGFE